MRKLHLRKPSPALVISCIALFVALGPAAYATHLVVRSGDIVDGEVKNPDLANLAVGAQKLAANAVTNSKIANNVVGPGKVIDNSLTGADLQNAASGSDDVNADMLDGMDSTGFLQNGATAGGDLAGSYPNPTVGPDAVTGAEVADGSITGSDVNESTLGTVPNATNAVNATNAGNADTLDGLDSSAYKPTLINFPASSGTARTQILSLGGFRLFASCLSSDLTLDAESTLVNSEVAAGWVSDGPGANTPLYHEMADLDPGEVFTNILASGDDESAGTITYRGPNGTSAVTVIFHTQEGLGFCFVSGTAFAA
jgi:hypothetical protein